MTKINTSPISGMQELSPNTQAVFDSLKQDIVTTYKSHGFFNIETPSIERTEILFAKAGGDTEKQIYKVFKTSESPENANQALRFDHTVPLARYVIEHESEITFPFKASQVGTNFRGERAQKGRFREFYQCDIDIIGRNELPITYDAEVIATLLDTFTAFGLETPVLARINNRKILSGFLAFLELTNNETEIYNIIDHTEKVTPVQTKLDLENLNIPKNKVKKILDFIEIHGDRASTIKALGNLEISHPIFDQGVIELDQTMYLLESINHQDHIQADMKIIRGLDYYTGTVFEFILPEYKNIGSVCGGGRYENLTQYFSDKTSFPGVGGSIGLTRLFYILNEKNLIKKHIQPIDYAIIPISESEINYSFIVANKLRTKGYSVTTVLTQKKLSDKLSYAAKIAQNGIVIGSNEVESSILQTKNFSTGETSELNLNSSANPEDFWAA